MKKILTLLTLVFAIGYANAQCSANFTLSQNAPGGTTVVLGGYNQNYGAYLWDFGDGNTSTSNNIAQYNYQQNGNYLVCLTIYDSLAQCTATYCDTVSVTASSNSGGNNTPCHITAAIDTIGFGAGTVSFINNSTGAMGYYWSFGDGSSSTAANPVHTYLYDSTYTVCLIAYDTTCADTVCFNVIVNSTGNSFNQNPNTCNASFWALDSGNFVMFLNNSIATTTNNTYHWDFGDGNTSSQQHPMHTYSTNGGYNVCLTIDSYDANGNLVCSDTHCSTVWIMSNQPTSCNASFLMFQDSSFVTSNTMYLFNLSTGNNLSYYWDFGDGNTSTLAFPTHVYAASGSYNVCLTVDDGNGCTSTYCQTIGYTLRANPLTINVLPLNLNGESLSIESPDFIVNTSVYPNPFVEQVNVEITSTQDANVEMSIIDVTGKVVFIQKGSVYVGSNKFNFDLSNTAKGIYFLNINNGTKTNTYKLMK